MGIDPASLTAIAAVTSAATGLGSTLMNSSGSSQQSSNTTNAALVNAINNQINQAGYNAEALKSSRAGYSDSLGTTQTYDPYTNTWKTTLGTLPQAAETSQYQADVLRNTTDTRQAEAANANAASRALSAADAQDSALRAIQAQNPMTPGGLTGALIEKATQANRETEQPLIADTLRQYARMGTSAAPVLSVLQRQSADDLRKSLIDATISGYTNAASVNSANMKTALDKYTTLGAGAQPTFTYPGIATDSTNNTMSQLAAYRANQATNAASNAAKDVTSSSDAVTGAAKTAAGNEVNTSASDALKLKSAGNSVSDLIKSGTSLYDALYGKSSNSGNLSNWQSNASSSGINWGSDS